jgi:hypothetical protein
MLRSTEVRRQRRTLHVDGSEEERGPVLVGHHIPRHLDVAHFEVGSVHDEGHVGEGGDAQLVRRVAGPVDVLEQLQRGVAHNVEAGLG